ncbi:threonine/serine exporter family protein [Ornithinimicrobium sp. INDO-MA30-4]|uniref:threonine/serine exporter family protein n=1 Tax=Ornithinimicrobium sp. INDO-MA30-4 TaxID=2908651 RepID=UPI001F419A48|nr:threonine/serine exporter family protein [Ornithinimicrobium sp. INDO-MA30-4]UJH70344.1 threonine/serine exporter family protein [Ornithinimicrobium sp. INDO-MA30-4]
MTTDRAASPDHEVRCRALVVQLGAAMIATGQPVNEVQADLMQVTEHLGYPQAQAGVGPTGLTLSLTQGGAATFGLAATGLQLDQSFDVRRIRHQVVYDEITCEEASEQLSALSDRPDRYPLWMTRLAWIILAIGITMILQPGVVNLAVAAVAAVLVRIMVELASKASVLGVLLPTAAAFAVGVLVFTAANYGLIDGALRTVLPPLAVLLPGALLVTGMSELAAGHMQAGSARLTYGAVQLALFAIGLLAATTLMQIPPQNSSTCVLMSWVGGLPQSGWCSLA